MRDALAFAIACALGILAIWVIARLAWPPEMPIIIEAKATSPAVVCQQLPPWMQKDRFREIRA